jgi:hypothetical protein
VDRLSPNVDEERGRGNSVENGAQTGLSRAEQDALLRRRAQELGVSESAVIRVCVQQAQAAEPSCDDKAWQEELAFIRERAAIPETGEKRRWTREELYDRPKRWWNPG